MAPVHSFAYVTGVTTDYETSVDQGFKQNRCDVTARLPRAILAERPKGSDRKLLEGATLVGERVDDPNKNCEDYLHTWQPVELDEAHRDKVHFAWPEGDPQLGKLLTGGIMLAVIAYVIFDRIRERWRKWRRAHHRR